MKLPAQILTTASGFFLFSFAGSQARASVVAYEAVFVIDSKTTLLPGLTPIIEGGGWGNTSVGNRYVVNFSIDTTVADTDDSSSSIDNALATGNIRNGNYQNLLTSLSITSAPGNPGSYNPAGLNFNLDTPTVTNDEVVIYKSNSNLAHNERINTIASVQPVQPILGGEMTDLSMNFRNIQPLGAENLTDYLDDRSLTTVPFQMDFLYGGPSAAFGDSRDLSFLTDDILGTGFTVTDLGRPLSLRFGEVTYLENISATHDLYAWGTFESLSVVPEPTTSSFLAGLGLFCLIRRKR